jgi:hypothetical protein
MIRRRRLPLSSRWHLIAAISSGGAIGDAPTAAMEAEGRLIEEVRRPSLSQGLP